MKYFTWLIVSLLTAGMISVNQGCQQSDIEEPVWQNRSDTLDIPIRDLVFNSARTDWEAHLSTFIQPIPLTVHYNETGFVLSQNNYKGLIQGPACILLRSGSNHFEYCAQIVNSHGSEIEQMDYRSPKTVTTDSSLFHQTITHSIDQWRNINPRIGTSTYFEEGILPLPTKIGIYRAQKEKPLSSFYVQAGSSVSIPVQVDYESRKEAFNIQVGPLMDRYNNIVADGTLVTLIYYDQEYTHQMEVTLLNGFAHAQIPLYKELEYILFAKVENLESQPIILKM